MALQPITSRPSNWRAPFTSAEILLGQGASTASAGFRTVLLCGPMLASGTTYTAGTVYTVTKEQDVIDGAGAGSPLHRLVRRFLQANKSAKLYVLPYAASSGGTPAKATGTVTISGSVTAAKSASVTVCGETVTYAFSTTDTPTTIAAGLVLLINAKVHLPLVASSAAGVLTLTAKIFGASQGDGTVGVYRFRSRVDAGGGISTADSGPALGISTGVAGTDGTTTENANLTAALANITSRRFYYMGFAVWNTTDTATIKTHVAAKSDPKAGQRSVAVTGYTHTLAACTTIAVARNYERCHIAWQKNSEDDPASIAANVCAVLQKREEVDPAFPGFDSYRQADWLVPPAYSSADWPTEDDMNDATTDGIIPIGSDAAGSYVGIMVNTRSKDSGGTLDDFRATERHRVSVMDDLVDTILIRHGLTYTSVGFKLRDDEYLSDGATVNQNQRVPPKVLTPSRYKPWIVDIFREYVDRGMLQVLPDWADSTRVNIDPSNSSRLEVGASGRVIDIMHQTTFRFAETTAA